MQAIRNFKGYPKLRDLHRILPSFTSLQVNIVVRYLERSKTIVIDNDGYIIWMRNEDLGQLTFGEVANMSSDFKELLEKRLE